MSESAAPGLGYGGFRVGGLRLALPMAALREVVACRELMALPCKAACVVGGIDLRGLVVPVVDLRIVLGDPGTAASLPNVIVMVHAGRLLGLLADGVTGVFVGNDDAVSRIGGHDAAATTLFTACVRGDDGQAVSVLCPEALALLPDVPMVRDEVPAQRLQAAGDGDAAVSDHRLAVPTVLVRCARFGLAIDAMAVHATLSDPGLQDSVLARGNCLGVIDYADKMVPAVDLLALCGLGAMAPGAARQAFVLSLPAGMVAFVVEEVVDVVPLPADSTVAVPACALPVPALFAGALPLTTLPPDVVDRARLGGTAFLVLDGAALAAHDEVAALACTNTPSPSAGAPASGDVAVALGAGHDAGQTRMLTYSLDGETATPLAQVREILAYTPEMAMFDSHGPMLGMAVHRGRTIPVMCLSQLCAGAPLAVGASASVLVVESGDELMGFAVSALRAIEPAKWEPELPVHGQQLSGAGARKLALVGEGSHERMLPVMDLQRMAQALRSQAMAGA